MRSRYQTLAIPTLNKSPYVFQEATNLNAIDIIELGCGKGQFIVGHAKRYPSVTHLGIELSPDVLYRAVQKIEAEPLDNLCFLWANVDDVLEDLQPCQILYLQFSDPWPKTRHEKRRLTTLARLTKYYSLVEDKIIFKTDNRDFYDYSLDQFKQSLFTIVSYGEVVYDETSLTTEFEDKYRKLHKPIYYIEAKK